MEENWKVYEHTFPNGKKYIGITKRSLKERFQNGKGYRNNIYMDRAIKKYGFENIKSKIVKENLNKEEAENLEIELIKLFKTQNSNFGYNICSGGLVNTHSEETRKKISLANIGNKKWLGKKHKEETKEKMKNKNFTEETRIKMSESRKKRITKLETRIKMSVNRKGIKFTEEHKEKIRKKSIENNEKLKKVIIYEKDGIENVFIGIKELSRFLKIESASIIRCCKEKQKTAGGYKFKYKED